MTCDALPAQLTAWRDGELPPETAAALETHLTTCAACAEAQAKLAAVREMAAAWTVDAPDLTSRVLQTIDTDEPSLILTEMRALRAEMQALRAEVADLRRTLARRDDPPAWFPLAKLDFSRLENDPWNLIRS